MNQNHAYGTFWEHLEELRRTLLFCLMAIGSVFLISLFYYEQLFQSLSRPLLESVDPNFKLILSSPAEGLSATFRLCFWVSLAIASPVCLYRILQFFLPAFEEGVKQLLIPFLIFSELFLALGGLFAFYLTIPIANAYLFSFNQTIGINLWSVSHYLDYTILLLLGNALAFELGVIGLFLVHLRLVSPQTLASKRKIAVLTAFIIGALLTPPDVLTQILMALPLIGLYEALILYGKLRN